MTEQKIEPLWEAVARSAAIVLSLPSMGQLRHHKSRILAPAREGVWVQNVANEPELIDTLIAAQQPAGISFRSGKKRYIFGTPILRRDPAFQLKSGFSTDALLLKTPATIRMVQRRTNYRVHVSADTGLSVRLWRIGPTAFLHDRVRPSQEVLAELRDISIGGIGVNLMPADGQPLRVSGSDRLKVQLTLNGENLTIEGRVRYPREIPNDARVVRAGIQFRIMQASMEGRQAIGLLTRVLGQLQRTELRRMRLGLTSVG